MKYFLILSLVSILLYSGCGYKEGISTSSQLSYLYFSGDTSSVLVSVDDGNSFSVKPGRDNQYRISPGKHNIKIFRNNRIIVEREIYVGDGVAKEIGVR